MAENETATIVTESRNLKTLPFMSSKDQFSRGKTWEDWLDWLEGTEREFRYFKISHLQNKKDAIIIYGGQ